MGSVVLFLACLFGIAALGFIVSRITGARAQYVETFALEDGERVLFRDPFADAYPVPKHRAKFVTYRRPRRGAALVTNLRIVLGTKPLFDSRHMIQYVLYPSDRPLPAEAQSIGGGLFKRGYTTLVFDRAVMNKHAAEKHPFVELGLNAAAASSVTLDSFRIYTDDVQAFRLPD